MFIIQYPTLVFGLVTYYTDQHEVDEDKIGISSSGGYWELGSQVGVAWRIMNYTPTESGDVAASEKKINPQ